MSGAGPGLMHGLIWAPNSGHGAQLNPRSMRGSPIAAVAHIGADIDTSALSLRERAPSDPRAPRSPADVSHAGLMGDGSLRDWLVVLARAFSFILSCAMRSIMPIWSLDTGLSVHPCWGAASGKGPL